MLNEQKEAEIRDELTKLYVERIKLSPIVHRINVAAGNRERIIRAAESVRRRIATKHHRWAFGGYEQKK